MTNIANYTGEVFEKIKHIDEEGNEYWYAIELMKALEYSRWGNFNKVIRKAFISYYNAVDNIYWFPEVRKPIIKGKRDS